MKMMDNGHHGQVGQDYFNLICKKYFVLYFFYFKMTYFGVRPVRYILNLSVTISSIFKFKNNYNIDYIYMEFLNNVFEQRDKPISDSSKKLYTRNLMKLNNDMPITNLY